MADIYAFAEKYIDENGVNKVRLNLRSPNNSADTGCRFKYIVPTIDFEYSELEKALNDAIEKEAQMTNNATYFTDEKANQWNTHFTLEKLGLPESTGKTLEMKNLWTGETTVIKNGVFFAEIEPHDCLLFRARVIDN